MKEESKAARLREVLERRGFSPELARDMTTEPLFSEIRAVFIFDGVSRGARPSHQTKRECNDPHRVTG